MDANPEPDNNPIPPPFAGRQAVFERIQQYLIDPADRHALLFIGRKSIGKSALLLQCQYILGSGVIGCYLPLTNYTFTNESDWLHYLVQQTNQILAWHQLNITRLPPLPNDPTEYRQMLHDSYLPELSKLIRPHRRFIWLMDDVEYLIAAIQSNLLPDDTLDYLFSILEFHLQIGIVMTIDEDNESQITALSPLVDNNRVQRLHPLSEKETNTLITQFTSDITKPAQQYIYHLTDGHPLLLQAIGDSLQTVIARPITKAEVNTIIDDVYLQAHETYREVWQNTLSQNERLVLTAISGLLYDDPIGNLTAQRIESWLLETDYPLDVTSINASIRGLEYRDLVIGSTSDGIRLRAQLFQRWLIEHARMDKSGVWGATQPTRETDNSSSLDRRSLVILTVLILIAIVFVALLQQSNTSASPPLEPTVTLES